MRSGCVCAHCLHLIGTRSLPIGGAGCCNPLALVGVLWRNITERMNVYHKGSLLDWLT